MISAAFLVMLASTFGAAGVVVYAVDDVPAPGYSSRILPSKRSAGLWFYNGVLYLALVTWMVCTYFCTSDGYDDIPAVRNSLCRPHIAEAE